MKATPYLFVVPDMPIKLTSGSFGVLHALFSMKVLFALFLLIMPGCIHFDK